VFQRATVILKRRPELQLEHALYAESHGELDRAERIYQTLLQNIPGHIESSLRYIHFKRRTLSADKVQSECAALYTKLLSETKLPSARALIAIEHARFLEHVLGEIERAREVFATETRTTSGVLELWLTWLHFEFGHRTGTERESAVAQLCTQALHGDTLAKTDRVELLRAWLDVVECCGTDIARERQISRDLLLLSAEQVTPVATKKRSSDSAELEQSPRPNKQSRAEEHSYTAGQYDQYYQNYAAYPGYANYYQGNYVNYQ
jgi:pre-mRNA-processing factor 39